MVSYISSFKCYISRLKEFSSAPIFFILIFAIFFIISFYSTKKKREILKKLSTYLTGYVSKFPFMASFNGEYQGLKFSIALDAGSRNSPPYLKIRLVKKSFLKLTVSKETFWSNLGNKIGLVHEVKTNDEKFDNDFLILSNAPAPAITYLDNADIKNTIRELFNSGFNSLSVDGKKILIQKPNYNLEQDVEPNNIREILQRLNLLAKGL